MITRLLTAVRIPLAGLLIAGGLAACSSSQEFVPPAPPPRVSVGEQLKKAEGLAKQAQEAQRAGRDDEAIALYKQALEAYRDFPGVWHNLGLLLFHKGDNIAAVEAFRTAGDLEPRDPRHPYMIGVIYENQGWNEEAQRYYTESLTRDANYHEALRRCVYIDMVENSFTPVTLERTRRALMAEQDPKWRDFFERAQLRLNAVLNQPPRPLSPPHRPRGLRFRAP